METTLVLLKNKLESIRQLTEVDSETKTTPQTVFTETLKEESNDTTANEKFEKKTGESLEEKNTSWSPDKSVWKNVGIPVHTVQPVRLKMQSQGLDDHFLDSFILKKNEWNKLCSSRVW